MKYLTILILFFVIASCDKDEDIVINDPDSAEKVSVDRFSENHGTLLIRDSENNLPEANEPIAFDVEPFITQSFGPDGQVVKYYNFDVQPLIPAPIYVLFKEGDDNPVVSQLNIIDVIPGELTYSDFWQIYTVTVPNDYAVNSVASFQDIIDFGYSYTKTDKIVNCPIVPFGSIANTGLNGSPNVLHKGWYKDKLVYYFSFEEKDITVDANNIVPTSPIYVTFNINPDDNNPDSGPASGFVVETGTNQTHNVIATIPSDSYYSPLWGVNIYNNTYFDNVNDLNTAKAAEILVENAVYVNCPVVYIE